MNAKQLGALLLLSSLWGGSFLFLRIASPELGPVLLIFLRVLLGGLTLLGLALAEGKLPPLRQHWVDYLVIGAVNSAIPFVLISWATISLPASLTATLNATTPLFGALAAALWLGEGLTLPKLVGLLLGLTGVAVLAGLGPLPLTTATLWAMGATLVAAGSYGLAAVYTKVRLPGGRPEATALYSLLFASLLLAPAVPFALPSAMPSPLALISVLLLALLCTALGYRLYYYLILSAGPTKAIMVTYLSPAFGMLWGVLFLREELGLGSLIGFALILASVGLVTRRSQPLRTAVVE